MTDIVNTKRRSELMAGIRGRDTAPELAVRRIAHRMGLRFRIHRKDLPGRPDLVLPKHHLVVFVHGCFWHRHEGCSLAYTPKSRVDFWVDKFASNISRDVRQQAALKTLGWRVLVIWECETRDEVAVRSRLAAAIHCEEPCPQQKETVSARMGPAIATVGK
ncbi:MAG: DNA mismatch endonuclease Vsr [Cyanobacteria bacterium MAG CAR4_bin_6]|nr:DNA mismatch endonuclease Vsr [Cyanobacteria bacterium MAG CAR4_bin_6]